MRSYSFLDRRFKAQTFGRADDLQPGSHFKSELVVWYVVQTVMTLQGY